MILFRYLKWKNMLSTGNQFTEIDLDKNNMTLIVGENGAGKSTILDALSFVLFNKPFRKINKPQLVNSITGKQLVVEVAFDISGVNYKVIRGIKPNIFELYVDDRLLNQDAAAKDYQAILESQILKINHKSFCQVVVLGSASFVPFMQLPAQQRREIIEDLLDLQVFTTMNILLKEKIIKNNEDIAEISKDKKIAEAQLTMLEEHLIALQQNNQKTIEEKEAKLIQYNNTLKDNYVESEKLIETSGSLLEKIKEQTSFKSKLDKLEKYRIQFNSKISNAQKTINFFHDHDSCPTCKQGIDHDFKQITIDSKSGQITEIHDALNKLDNERNKIIEQLNEFDVISKKLQETNFELSKLDINKNNLRYSITEIENEITALKKDKETINTSKIDDLRVALVSYDKSLQDLHDMKTTYGAAATILKDGGIKAKITKQYIPIINKLINKYLSSMDFFVNFELNEQFDETIKSRFRDEFSYASFSEGEKMRINLAILFTWRAISKMRSSVNTNLLIMDEVFDSSLDANGVEEFMKILQSLTIDTNTFIISHKTENITDKFEKIVVFEKHKNFSRIVS